MASDTYRVFTARLQRFAQQEVPEKANLVKRRVALQILNGVVTKSPVDTGRFRSNWQVTLGLPARGEVEGVRSAEDVLSTGVSVIAQSKPGETVWLTNNVPYALPLEEGHSEQAPSGVVAVTVAEVETQFGRR